MAKDDDKLKGRKSAKRFQDANKQALSAKPVMDVGPVPTHVGAEIERGLGALEDPLHAEIEPRERALSGADIEADAPPADTTADNERRLAALRMLADKPIRAVHQDLLGFSAYADALAALINNPNTATPLTVAVNARWGNGKSSLGRLTKERLAEEAAADGDHPHRTLWFNAWMHDDAGSLATAFVADIVQKLDPQRPLWHRIARPLPIALAPPSERPMLRLKYAAVVVAGFLLVSLAGFAAVGFDASLLADLAPGATESEEHAWLNRVVPGAGFLVSLLLALGRPLLEASRAVRDFVQNPGLAASSGSMERVRKQLGRMVNAATPRGSRLVIFVDDLDRVRPPAAVELLEAANQLMSHEDVVVVIMADLPAIAAQAEIKYSALASKFRADEALARPDGETAQSYGRQYLQKIVQLQFDLPPQSPERMKSFLRDVALWADLEPVEHDRFQRFRGVLSWPWGVMRTMTERRRRRRLRALAWDELSTSMDPITAEPSISLLGDTDEHAALARAIFEEQRSLKIENDSALLDEALQEAFRHLPPSPRNAKRILNRLRLLLHLAHARALLFAGSPLRPAHIGHWAVLQERWPELVQALSADPGALTALESSARDGDPSSEEAFDGLVRTLVPRYGSVPALKECLSRGAELAPVAQALVAFEPSLLPTSPDSAPPGGGPDGGQVLPIDDGPEMRG